MAIPKPIPFPDLRPTDPTLDYHASAKSDHGVITYPRAGGPGNVYVTIPAPDSAPDHVKAVLVKIDRLIYTLMTLRVRIMRLVGSVADADPEDAGAKEGS